MAARSESAKHPGDEPQQRKVLLSVDDDLKTRMKWTIEHTRARTGITTQQMFIRVAILNPHEIQRETHPVDPFSSCSFSQFCRTENQCRARPLRERRSGPRTRPMELAGC